VFDLRMMLIRLRHKPAIRAILEFPDRMDAAVLLRSTRAIAWGRPRWNALSAVLRRAGGSMAGRTAPGRARLAGWGRRGVGCLYAVPMSCWIGLLTTALLLIPSRVTPGRIPALCQFSGMLPAQLGALPAGSLDFLLQSIQFLSLFLTVLLPVAALAAFLRKRVSHLLLKAGAAGFLLLTLFLWWMVTSIPGQLNAVNSEVYPNYVRNELWVNGVGRVMPWLVFALFTVVVLSRRSVAVFYGAPESEPRWADKLWANMRSHGAEPGFRKALYWSGGIHFFLIFLVPMLAWWGCDEAPYGVPEGSGTPQIEMVKVKRVKKKPEKKYVLNMNTAVSFYVPKLEDSEVLEEVDKETQNTYEAQKLGKLGQGGGKQGGWPNGMKNARVRFIRLQYDGGDWDQDMGYGADYNLLLKFRDYTGFEIASETESRPIAQLKRFPKNRAPPFVYLTGGLKGSINLSNAEIKILREYCLDMGGLLFADNGGGQFDRNFRPLMKRIFPDLPMVEISKDDVIFQQPFSFPNGAPPLWHHSGNNAMGIKYKGRWVVFYHQGDVNDAWKAGHSGASEGVTAQAYKLGVNVINYAFNQYMMLNFNGDVPK
jgi:hypothetical protein